MAAPTVDRDYYKVTSSPNLLLLSPNLFSQTG